MKKKNYCQRSVVVALLLAVSITVTDCRTVFAGYSWDGDVSPYVDLSQWVAYAAPYIESMRRAKVISGFKQDYYYYFRPTQIGQYDVSGPRATRAWYGMALAERLTPLDDCTVCISGTDWYWDNRRWFVPYANEMASNGLIGYGTFSDGNIKREEAFAWVIRIAGLERVAQAMSPSEVSYWLGLMADGNDVSTTYRNDVALAIKLGICKGDMDNKIMPQDTLYREHAVLIVFRAIAINFWPDPVVFRPIDGQTTTIRCENIGAGTVNSWTLSILDDSMSKILRQWSGSSLPSVLATWDGKDSVGQPAPAGWYWVKLDVSYVPPDSTSAVSLQLPPRRVRIDARSLNAWVLTSTTTPDNPFHLVEAKVTGTPSVIRVDASWGSSVPMVYDPQNGLYVGAIGVPTSLARGIYSLSVFAVLEEEGLDPLALQVKADVVAGGKQPYLEPATETETDKGAKPALPVQIRLKGVSEKDEP